MSSTHVQLVKWSFPAFALLIGLLWYRRRRVDRVDPGGTTKTSRERKVSVANECGKKTGGRSSAEKNALNGSTSFCDSGIHIDESILSLNASCPPIEDLIRSPRRVSESLDIPRRRSSSHPLSAHSGTSTPDGQSWYWDGVDALPDPVTDVQLGSNPRTSNFEMIARSRAGTSFVADGKMPRVFENLAEDEERRLVGDDTPTADVDLSPVERTENACAGNALDGCTAQDAQTEDQQEEQPKNDAKAQAQALSERDSANHSPVSGVLEGSVTDEVRSEGSTDSGKGGSIRGHAKDAANVTIYEFSIPQYLVGRLIGRHGFFLQQIRVTAEVHIVVKRHPTSRDLKVCTIEGSTEGINQALKIIRERFPLKKYPNVTLEQLSLLNVPDQLPWTADLMQLSLVEGVNNDVIVCHILKPNQLFVHLPTHPTYPSLRILDENMTLLYETTESPAVPDQLTKGMIVVAKWYDRWIRVYIENPDPLGERHLVRSVDHGGYWTFSSADMRKIRLDYLTLPFQAIEVFLGNIQPKDGEWKQEAYNVVAQICSGAVGQAQIESYIDTNTHINLYVNVQKHGVISLADELVARGLAEPVQLEETAPEGSLLDT